MSNTWEVSREWLEEQLITNSASVGRFLETMSLSSNSKIFFIPFLLFPRKKQSFLYFIQRSFDPSSQIDFLSSVFPLRGSSHHWRNDLLSQARRSDRSSENKLYSPLTHSSYSSWSALFMLLRPFKWWSELKIKTRYNSYSTICFNVKDNKKYNISSNNLVVEAGTFALHSFLCRFRSPEKWETFDLKSVKRRMNCKTDFHYSIGSACGAVQCNIWCSWMKERKLEYKIQGKRVGRERIIQWKVRKSHLMWKRWKITRSWISC